MRHRHHIIPRHMGGSNDPSNLFECSVEEHAELHFDLYLTHGKWEDYIAYTMLAGLNDDGEWARLSASNTPENRAKKAEKVRQYRASIKGQPYYTEEHKKHLSKTATRIAAEKRARGEKLGRTPKRVLCDGVLYHNIKEMSSALNIHLQTAYSYIYSGRAQYQ